MKKKLLRLDDWLRELLQDYPYHMLAVLAVFMVIPILAALVL